MAKNGVDGVYTADPKQDPSATLIEQISYADALVRGLKVVDSTSFSLCMDNGMPMRVFGMEPAGNVTAAIRGSRLGSLSWTSPPRVPSLSDEVVRSSSPAAGGRPASASVAWWRRRALSTQQ